MGQMVSDLLVQASHFTNRETNARKDDVRLVSGILIWLGSGSGRGSQRPLVHLRCPSLPLSSSSLGSPGGVFLHIDFHLSLVFSSNTCGQRRGKDVL